MPEIMDTVLSCTQHTFLFLTKQPQNLIKWSPFPDNAWVGVTATDAMSFLEAGRGLEQIEAKVKYISLEPLLDHIGGLWMEGWLKSGVGIKWVIIGQCTPVKQSTRPAIEHVQEIVEACGKAGIAVFLKKNLEELIAANLYQCGWAIGDNGDLRQEMPKVI